MSVGRQAKVAEGQWIELRSGLSFKQVGLRQMNLRHSRRIYGKYTPLLQSCDGLRLDVSGEMKYV